MNSSGWIQLALYVGVLLALTKPMGLYIVQVLDPAKSGRRPFLEPVLGPLALTPSKEESETAPVPDSTRRPGALCGERLDWVESVAP